MLTNSTSPSGVFIERAQNNWREKQAGDTMAGKNLAGEKMAEKKGGKEYRLTREKKSGREDGGRRRAGGKWRESRARNRENYQYLWIVHKNEKRYLDK